MAQYHRREEPRHRIALAVSNPPRIRRTCQRAANPGLVYTPGCELVDRGFRVTRTERRSSMRLIIADVIYASHRSGLKLGGTLPGARASGQRAGRREGIARGPVHPEVMTMCSVSAPCARRRDSTRPGCGRLEPRHPCASFPHACPQSERRRTSMAWRAVGLRG